MTLTWIANTSQGRMVGDYISSSFVAGGRALPIWARGYAPQGGIFDLGMETIMGGIDVGAATGAIRAGNDTPLASPSARPSDRGAAQR